MINFKKIGSNIKNLIPERVVYVEKSAVREQYSEEQLLIMLAERLGDVTEHAFDSKEEKLIFKELGKVEGFGEYLRATCARDIQRYFATNEEDRVSRNQIRGAFARTMYFRAGLANKEKEFVEKDTSIPGLRYGS